MRVSGGELGGRRLLAPPGLSVRPTTDKVRQALFNILFSLCGTAPKSVLDLYAGTGALGIEALSRGAQRAVFVERDAHALKVLGSNLQTFGLLPRATILSRKVAQAWDTLLGLGPFDWIFADPPYDAEEGPVCLRALGETHGAVLAPGAVVVVEHGLEQNRGATLQDDYGALQRFSLRSYGQTALSFYGKA